MANSYTCSCCRKDGTYCDCFRAGTKCTACRLRGEIKRPYQTSPEDRLMKERLDLRAERFEQTTEELRELKKLTNTTDTGWKDTLYSLLHGELECLQGDIDKCTWDEILALVQHIAKEEAALETPSETYYRPYIPGQKGEPNP